MSGTMTPLSVFPDYPPDKAGPPPESEILKINKSVFVTINVKEPNLCGCVGSLC